MAGAQRGVAQRDVLGVVVGHDQHVGAARQLGRARARAAPARGGRAPRPPRRPSDAEPLAAELVGAGVDQVQLEVVPGQDPGQLEPDVADAEDRDGRHDGAAARAAPSPRRRSTARRARRRLVGEARRSNGSGAAAPLGEQLAGPATAVASRLPPPMLPQVRVGGDDHLGAGLARRVPADRASVTSTPGCGRAAALDRGQPATLSSRRVPARSDPAAAGAASAGWSGPRRCTLGDVPCSVAPRACSTAQ